MKKVLLTGFEPFGGERINPAWEVAQRVAMCSEQVDAIQLPCVFDDALSVLYAEIDKRCPDIVICLGQASGRAEISLERVAINLNDAAISDNQGKQPIDTPVVAGAPSAYFTTLPVKAMVQAVRNQGIPASLSLSAGSYVCNHTMYGLLHYLALYYPNCRGGFIHLPLLPEQGVHHRKMPTMALDMLVKGIWTAVETACHQQQDLSVTGGIIC